MPPEAQRLAEDKKFELKGYALAAAAEQTRSPRVVRVALVQNQIVLPTTDPILQQVYMSVRNIALDQEPIKIQ